MNTLNEVVKLHKVTQEGFTSKLPKFIIKLWYILHLQILNTSCLIISTIDQELEGFILFNLNRNEISFISVNPKCQREGVGSELISRLKSFDNVIVKHNEYNREVKRFYEKNGFKEMFEDGGGFVWSMKNQ